MAAGPWRPSAAVTLLIGALTLWPIIYLWLFIRFMFAPAPVAFDTMLPIHLGTMLLTFALVAIYIVHLFKTDLIPNDKKTLWAVVLFLGSFFACAVYWFLYMWRPVARVGG